ncbi:MAG: hypothetical protein N7Q72_04625, partial [Spiroplasma sp. Tabriz.8]|nr:hypothetical protein [Spiroplasma sp. Tabriz.8]
MTTLENSATYSLLILQLIGLHVAASKDIYYYYYYYYYYYVSLIQPNIIIRWINYILNSITTKQTWLKPLYSI